MATKYTYELKLSSRGRDPSPQYTVVSGVIDVVCVGDSIAFIGESRGVLFVTSTHFLVYAERNEDPDEDENEEEASE